MESVPATKRHRFGREVDHSSALAREVNTKKSGYWISGEADTAKVTQTDPLKFQASRSLACKSTRDVGFGGSRRDRGASMSKQARESRGREATDVIRTDEVVEADPSENPSSKRRETLPGLAFSDKQLAAVLADDGVRVAIAREGKVRARGEKETVPFRPRNYSISSAFNAGHFNGAVTAPSASGTARKATSILSSPLLRQKTTALPRTVRIAGEEASPGKNSTAEES